MDEEPVPYVAEDEVSGRAEDSVVPYVTVDSEEVSVGTVWWLLEVWVDSVTGVVELVPYV